MPRLITVKAAPGIKVPRADKWGAYIDDATAVSGIASAYYRRRIADGDLLTVTAEVAASADTEDV